MAYLKINEIDFSNCVNKLTITNNHQYNAQMNAAGNTVVDYINRKRTIDVGIIPLDDEAMQQLLNVIENLHLTLSFRNPATGELEDDVSCILPKESIDYYTIQAGKVLFKAFNLTFTEL